MTDRKDIDSAQSFGQKKSILLVAFVLILSILLVVRELLMDSFPPQSHLVPVVPDHHCIDTTLAAEEEKYYNWFASYQAPDPKNTAYCKGVMSNKPQNQQRGSQFEQDMFLFHNLFKYWPMNGKKGVYVDSGANAAVALSNTYFFDVCLGWKGVCIEPETVYHEDLKKYRSCTLVPTCLGSKKETITFSDAGVSGHKVEKGGKGRTITCQPLETVLREAGHTDLHVDLWSLDVEGFEMPILENLKFDEISISALLIEDFWISKRDIDSLMTKNGFIAYHTMSIDTLYVNRYFQHAAQKVTYPPYWDKYMELNVAFRQLPETRQKLVF